MSCAGFSSRSSMVVSALGSASCSTFSSWATARTAMALEVAAEWPWRPLTRSRRSPARAVRRRAQQEGEEKAAWPFDCAVCLCELGSWHGGEAGVGMATGADILDGLNLEHTAQRRRPSSVAARGVRRRHGAALRGRTGCRKDGGRRGGQDDGRACGEPAPVGKKSGRENQSVRDFF
ncbi:unnamed protein product [Urochloa humidicola]